MAEQTTPPPTAAGTAPPKSKSVFSGMLKYLEDQAHKVNASRWEGSSYLSAPGPEPQQRYKYAHKNKKRSGSE